VWNVAAPDWNQDWEEYWWSITNPDGSNRPAYDALLAARRSGYLPSETPLPPIPTAIAFAPTQLPTPTARSVSRAAAPPIPRRSRDGW